MEPTTPITYVALNCTLKAEGTSSTQILLDQVLAKLQGLGATGESLRVAAMDVQPGVTSEAQGPGDAWPDIRQRIIDADVLLLATPIWLGNPSSICRRVLERMDALLGETDDEGRMVTFGKVAGVVTVGNEDGAHTVTAQCYQALADVGFTVPAAATTYWVGEAMGATDYADLDEVPDGVASATAILATNVAHLARVLRGHPYPAPGA